MVAMGTNLDGFEYGLHSSALGQLLSRHGNATSRNLTRRLQSRVGKKSSVEKKKSSVRKRWAETLTPWRNKRPTERVMKRDAIRDTYHRRWTCPGEDGKCGKVFRSARKLQKHMLDQCQSDDGETTSIAQLGRRYECPVGLCSCSNTSNTTFKPTTRASRPPVAATLS